MATSFVSTVSLPGMLNTAVTVVWLGCASAVAAIVPMVALVTGTPAPGGGGVAFKVNVTAKLFVPCGAELGVTVWIRLVTAGEVATPVKVRLAIIAASLATRDCMLSPEDS